MFEQRKAKVGAKEHGGNIREIIDSSPLPAESKSEIYHNLDSIPIVIEQMRRDHTRALSRLEEGGSKITRTGQTSRAAKIWRVRTRIPGELSMSLLDSRGCWIGMLDF